MSFCPPVYSWEKEICTLMSSLLCQYVTFSVQWFTMYKAAMCVLHVGRSHMVRSMWCRSSSAMQVWYWSWSVSTETSTSIWLVYSSVVTRCVVSTADNDAAFCGPFFLSFSTYCCSFEQGSSLLWTHTLRPFYSRPIALTQEGRSLVNDVCECVREWRVREGWVGMSSLSGIYSAPLLGVAYCLA